VAEERKVEYDEPSVMGAGCGSSPMPTEADHKAAWRHEFIRHCVAMGWFDEASAAAYFEAGADDWDYTEAPADAIAEDMQYWDDDGDAP
jgi:hypothetical protein